MANPKSLRGAALLPRLRHFLQTTVEHRQDAPGQVESYRDQLTRHRARQDRGPRPTLSVKMPHRAAMIWGAELFEGIV
jgi:hypothetical protein